MPLDVVPNQDFLKFISIQEDKKNLKNLDLILNLDKKYPGMFIKVMSNFDKVQKKRKELVEGRSLNRTWEDAMIETYYETQYIGVTKENEDIAQLCAELGISQEVFNMMCELRQEQKENNIPEHILGKQIKEETILESIERIKSQTEEELTNGREMIEELYDKQFTYEWLSKNDPHNGILGLFCSCCGTIESTAYGKDIAKASLIAKDVQNLVVRDYKGNIISKGTMYVNKEEGYAVINDFELNEKYRHHEDYRKYSKGGTYDVPETSSEEQDREMIFKAFQRGLSAFIEEYNRQNPNNPLKQINIGMGYNRLKKQVERFKKATSNLTVPDEYSFKDAMTGEQYILYQREQKQIENGGQGR